MERKQVRVGKKIDLDTCGAGFLLGITQEDEVQVVSQASPAELADPKTICIECGWRKGSFNNWDHHQEGAPSESAVKQVFWQKTLLALQDIAASEKGVSSCVAGSWCFDKSCSCNCLSDFMDSPFFIQWDPVVEYINQLDTEGATSMPNYGRKDLYPFLSDVFAGMLILTAGNPLEQFFKGIELLKTIIDSKQDPYGQIKGFDAYAETKAKNDRQVAEAVKVARWDTTRSGRKLGYLETEFFGAPGALYGQGAQVVVALNPNFNGVRKFTIAGNGIGVSACTETLNAIEPGWGGHPTIIGSPREGGSHLSLEEVVRVVRECL